jgi:hypothetical protein
MKAILGDYSDIPENLAEPTLSSTARDVTLWLDDLALRSTEHCVRAAHRVLATRGDYGRPLFSCGSSTCMTASESYA